MPNTPTKAPYILALDLGPNSIGWAMIRCEEEGNGRLKPLGLADTTHAQHPPLGVRVFEAGLKNFDTKKEASLAQKRRTSRAQRRTVARRAQRKRRLRELLMQSGMEKSLFDVRSAVMKTDPYELRSRGLDDPLTKEEVVRALYHLGQRRGFKSNRKTEAEGSEDGKLKKAISAFESNMEDEGARTIGEYLHGQMKLMGPAALVLGSSIRNKQHGGVDQEYRTAYSRAAVENEFEELWKAQAEHHDWMTPRLRKEVHHAVFYQTSFEVTPERRERAPRRANLHRAPEVRRCSFFEELEVCPKAEWIAQRFRILKEANNLRVGPKFGEKAQLTLEERSVVIDKLSEQRDVTFDSLRTEFHKQFGHPENVVFNLELGERKKLEGNELDARITNAISKKKWRALAEDERQELRTTVQSAEDQKAFEAILSKYTTDQKKVDALRRYTGPSGHMAYSKHALEILVPYLEGNKSVPPLDEYGAIQQAISDGKLDTRTVEAFQKLPALAYKPPKGQRGPVLPQEIQNITNPLVRRAVGEVRKVVNALLREHGLPARITVELARELKQHQDDRKEHSKRSQERGRLHDKAREAVGKLGGNPDNFNHRLAWLLWNEQMGQCVYTGRAISQSALFGGDLQIDHILPRWKSGDDSQANKVLVYRDANAKKGDRTPAQWLGVDGDEFKSMLLRAEKMAFTKRDERQGYEGRMPASKYRRLQQVDCDAEGFTKRQLNDTRYISRVVARFLNLLYPPEERVGEKRVASTRGGLTAELRHFWGLNSILDELQETAPTGIPLAKNKEVKEGKSREDHRHHAIDAVVVGLSTRAFLKRHQDYVKQYRAIDLRENAEDRQAREHDFPKPWESLRADIREALKVVNVSHRPQRKIMGGFHKANSFGPVNNEDGRRDPNKYVTRVSIQDLSSKDITKKRIRDLQVRALIEERLHTAGWDGTSALPKDWWQGGISLPGASGDVPVFRVRIVRDLSESRMLPIRESAQAAPHKYAPRDGNHHLVEWLDQATGEVSLEIVSMVEAARRARRSKDRTIYEQSRDARVARMHLCRKDSVLVTKAGAETPQLCVLQNMSDVPTLFLVFRSTNDSRRATIGNLTPYARIRSEKGWKEWSVEPVEVDAIGRIRHL